MVAIERERMRKGERETEILSWGERERMRKGDRERMRKRETSEQSDGGRW